METMVEPIVETTVEVIYAIENASLINAGFITTLIFFVGIVAGALIAQGLWGVHKND